MTDDRSILRVAIIGFGTMGAGIAERFSECGYEVTATDVNEQRLNAGRALIAHNQEMLVERGLLAVGEVEESRLRLRTTQCLSEAIDQAELVIECIPEEMKLKKKLFAELSRQCDCETILASNTSGLSITSIASSAVCPERVAGYHWWNPPHIMPLVEVVRGEQTSSETASILVATAKDLGKTPIVVHRDVPGFVGNRLQLSVFREALHLLSAGIATAEDIDKAMTAGPGLRYGLIGPLQTADLGGLDVFHAISEYLFPELSGAQAPPGLLGKMVEEGKHGAKSHEGFFSYPGGLLSKLVETRDRYLVDLLELLPGGAKKPAASDPPPENDPEAELGSESMGQE